MVSIIAWAIVLTAVFCLSYIAAHLTEPWP